MLNNFDPKEKKAIILFIGALILGVIYFSTNKRPNETFKINPLREEKIENYQKDEDVSNSSRFL